MAEATTHEHRKASYDENHFESDESVSWYVAGARIVSLMIKQGEDKALSSASAHITIGLLPRALLVTP